MRGPRRLIWRGGQADAVSRAIPAAKGFGQTRRYAGVATRPEKDAVGTLNTREFVLFYQDGLNLHDDHSEIPWTLDGVRVGIHPVPDCTVCDESYDRG